VSSPLRARSGGALALALIVLLVIDCVVLGIVHLAMLERRLADNAATALRLRLAAESAARVAAVAWSPALDSLAPGGSAQLLLAVTDPHGVSATAAIERLSAVLFLVRTAARLPDPRPGRASAALLLVVPALSEAMDPAAAALTAATARVTPTGSIDAGNGECTHDPVPAARLLRTDDFAVIEPGTVHGSVVPLDDPLTLTGQLPRILAAAANTAALGERELLFTPGDLLFDDTGAGVIVAGGSVTFAAGSSFSGLVIAAGSFVLSEDAAIRGAAHVLGSAELRGSLVLDACAVLSAVGATGLRRPRPLAERAWLPWF
jgi:hypothetical protein